MPLMPDLTQEFVREFQQLSGELEALRQRKPAADPGVAAARDEALALLAAEQRKSESLQIEISSLKRQLADAANQQPAVCMKCERIERDLLAARQQADALNQEIERLKETTKLPKADTKALDEKLRSLQVELEEREARISKQEDTIIELEQDLWKLRQGKSSR